MSAPADRLHFAFATPGDEADLHRLLRETPIPGAIRVSFQHEPDFFLGTGLAGATEQILLGREAGRLVAVGRCTTRPGWLNGTVRRIAYLNELRLAASAQGRWDILRSGYAFFAAAYAQDPADFCFTSIIADNIRARRLLERGARGLPRYEFIGEYVTHLLSATASRPSRAYTVATGTGLSPDALADFLNGSARSRHLAAHWTPENLRALIRHGLRPEDFVVLRNGTEIVACAGIWDQRTFRQIQIERYQSVLAVARPFYNLLAPWLGQPRLPSAGSQLQQAYLSPWAIHPDCEEARPALIQAARDAAARRGVDCLVLGSTPGDPTQRSLPGWRYRSRLYRVDWPGVARRTEVLDPRPCLPDIALL